MSFLTCFNLQIFHSCFNLPTRLQLQIFPLFFNMNTELPPFQTTRNQFHLSNAERHGIYEALLSLSVNGELRKGSFTKIATQFSTSQRTTRRIWHEAKKQQREGLIVDVSSKIGKFGGSRRIQINPEAVSAIPLRNRSSIRSLGAALGVAKSSVHRKIKEGLLRPHTNAIKPVLTEANKRARLAFCFQHVDRFSSRDKSVFDDMFNKVHIDEKWFYMTKATKRYYLVQGEAEPIRTCKSKSFITKVMFLAAVARPRFCHQTGREVFSGKIGIFPFTRQEPARRSSKNRLAGTPETKPIMSVTKDVTRAWLIDNVN